MAVDVKTATPETDASLSSDPASLRVAPDDIASSSDADQSESKESLLEAVQTAVPEMREAAEKLADDDRASPATDKSRADDDSDLPEEVTPDELARLSKTAQRRISKLSKQRQRLAGEVERLKSLEPSAQAADQVTQYLVKADIGRDDFLMGLELMAAMRRGDFHTFYEGIKPYVRLCEEYLGVTLPADLQMQVQQGQMTTQAAAQYSKERMDRAIAQSNAARQQQAYQQYQSSTQQTIEQQQKQYLAKAVQETVEKWEAGVMRADPDYPAKQAAVQNTMWAVVREQGPPQSPEHAVAIAKESLRRVNEQYRSWVPTRRPTLRTPSSTGRTGGVAPEPKNLLEVVRYAREGRPRL
jgi:hypothetical protein